MFLDGILDYEVKIAGYEANQIQMKLKVNVQLRNKLGKVVGLNSAIPGIWKGSVIVTKVNLWWPYLMQSDPGYLYQMEIFLYDENMKQLLDVYRMKMGFRKLFWDEHGMTINGKQLYLRGFGKHEDSDVSIII